MAIEQFYGVLTMWFVKWWFWFSNFVIFLKAIQSEAVQNQGCLTVVDSCKYPACVGGPTWNVKWVTCYARFRLHDYRETFWNVWLCSTLILYRLERYLNQTKMCVFKNKDVNAEKAGDGMMWSVCLSLIVSVCSETCGYHHEGCNFETKFH